jgi:SPP1 family predicted phage head-tail adaptor
MIAPRTTTAERPHLITFENPGKPVPSGTTFVQSWVDQPPFDFAEIAPATARRLEQLSAGTISGTATHILTTGFRPGVSLKSRVRFDGRIFNVIGFFDPEERHIDLVLVCAEVLT